MIDHWLHDSPSRIDKPSEIVVVEETEKNTLDLFSIITLSNGNGILGTEEKVLDG